MKRPNEADYTSQVAYTRALEEYCDTLAQPEQEPNNLMQDDYLMAARIAEGYKPDRCPPLIMPLAGLLYSKAAQEPNNFCPRCGKRLEGVLGRPQVHTCTPPLWGHT